MKKTVLLLLARHGNTFEEGETPRYIGQGTDIALTKKGREQGKEVGEFFARAFISPKAIYSGNLIRQTETAEIIAEKIGAEVIRDSTLDEVNLGPWEGLTEAEIKTNWPEELKAWKEEKDSPWPENICKESKINRIKKLDQLFKGFLNLHKDGTNLVLVSSHKILRLIYEISCEPCGGLQGRVGTGKICLVRIFSDAKPEMIQWNVDPKRKFSKPFSLT